MQSSSLKMQRYILGWCGLMMMFGVTYAIALVRVSQTEKFAGQPVHSQTCESKTQSTYTAVSWIETCRLMSAAAQK